METVVNNCVTREIQVRDISEEMIEKRQVEFVISTEAVDTYGTVFRSDGWLLDRYNSNPIVLYGHRSWDGNPDMVVGTGYVFKEDRQLIGRVTFETEDLNPIADKVFRKIQAGTLRMASIGADPKKGHWGVREAGEDPDVLYFDEQELLEFSIVPIGSNPEALKRTATAFETLKTQFPKSTETPPAITGRSVREAQLIINQNH